MEFTKENWENAPEGARLEWRHPATGWKAVHFVGTTLAGSPVIEEGEGIGAVPESHLRIVLPKRKVTVQLWQGPKSKSLTAIILGVDNWKPSGGNWTLIGEHTFEVEGK